MPRVNNSYYAILGILSVGPMSGYQIKLWVDTGVGFFCNIDYKQIYPTLKKLVDEDLATFEVVKLSKRPESKIYKLTDLGLKELKNWLEKPVQDVDASSGHTGAQSNNELLLKLFFGHNTSLEINLDHLEKCRNYSLNYVQKLNSIVKSIEQDPKKDDFWYYRMTTINKGISSHQSQADWCVSSMEYLRNNIK